MTGQESTDRSGGAIAVDAPAADVVAGDEFTVHVRFASGGPDDELGRTLRVEDEQGRAVDIVTIDDVADEEARRLALVLRAPMQPATYTWSAVAAAPMGVSAPGATSSAAFAFRVAPHATRLVVWGVPGVVEPDSPFEARAGVKCVRDCRFPGERVLIRDHEGSEVSAAAVGADPWPGTSALRVAEFVLRAPARAGDYAWEAAFTPSHGGATHVGDARPFLVRVVDRPECVVTVEVVDHATQAPIAGAHVRLHPYAAVTDERGVATVPVVKAEYALSVSKTDFATHSVRIDVAEDLVARAELVVERAETVDDLY